MIFYVPVRRVRMRLPVGRKELLVMRLSILLLFTALHVGARTVSQTVTYSCENTPLATVFKELKKQTGMAFIYNEPVGKENKVTINAEKMSLADFLHKILAKKGLQYSIKSRTVAVFQHRIEEIPPAVAYALQAAAPPFDLSGRIVDSAGRPISGASITLKGSKIGTNSGSQGYFSLKGIPEKGILLISYAGFESREVAYDGNNEMGSIEIKESVGLLSEVQIVAYGEVKRKYLTSNISKVSGEELSKQPVGNPLQGLEGRVPGMIVSQVTGVPGARLNVQVRGRANFDANLSTDQPLFVIDGVPMAANNDKVNSLPGPFGPATTDGLSAFAGLNTADIESIDVLKDADATAIYGSRGANGVILITTRKPKAGKLRTNANVNSGVSTVSRMPKMMNTQQYLEMRNEAFKNDNATKTNTNAYDLLLWNQTRYTDFADLLVGNNAKTTDAQINFSGGNRQTQVRLGAAYRKEGTVWPGNKSVDRFSASFGSRTMSENEKFTMDFSGTYSVSKSDIVAGDLAGAIILPPNFRLYNDDGSLSWSEGGYSGANSQDNPLSLLNQKYVSNMVNLNANLMLNYKLTEELTVRTSLGYNTTQNNDRRATPIAAQNPFKANLTGQSAFGNTQFKNWIVEPQLEYNKHIGKGKLNALLGATFNKRESSSVTATGFGYASDDLLGSLSGATSYSTTNALKKYSYQAFFGRLNYILDEKYVVNLTARRDGSSRFGPDFRFSNFGAVGAAWLFSNENFLKNNAVLSFGKLRASYGITGNDQIGDYSYLDTWTSGVSTYTDSATLVPGKLYAPALHWEGNIKAEIGIELGFAKDRILFTASAYRNVSSDPLATYPLPVTTGFSTIVTNLNGVKVENRGVELTLNSKNIRAAKAGAFSWSTDFNMTIPQNRLQAFPDLQNSSYSTSYTIGQSLNQAYAAQYLGVDPATGLYKIQDKNSDGVMGAADFAGAYKTDPRFYGGLNNNFSYKGFNFSFFLQFTSQMGKSWKTNNLYNPPGAIFNAPVEVMGRWQSAGQETDIQKYTTSPGSPLGLSGFYSYMFSGGTFTDASFLRLKNVNISYDLPGKWLKPVHISSFRVYLQGQNLFVITGYKVSDPESQNYTRMPPLRTLTAGLQLSL